MAVTKKMTGEVEWVVGEERRQSGEVSSIRNSLFVFVFMHGNATDPVLGYD